MQGRGLAGGGQVVAQLEVAHPHGGLGRHGGDQLQVLLVVGNAADAGPQGDQADDGVLHPQGQVEGVVVVGRGAAADGHRVAPAGPGGVRVGHQVRGPHGAEGEPGVGGAGGVAVPGLVLQERDGEPGPQGVAGHAPEGAQEPLHGGLPRHGAADGPPLDPVVVPVLVEVPVHEVAHLPAHLVREQGDQERHQGHEQDHRHQTHRGRALHADQAQHQQAHGQQVHPRAHQGDGAVDHVAGDEDVHVQEPEAHQGVGGHDAPHQGGRGQVQARGVVDQAVEGGERQQVDAHGAQGRHAQDQVLDVVAQVARGGAEDVLQLDQGRQVEQQGHRRRGLARVAQGDRAVRRRPGREARPRQGGSHGQGDGHGQAEQGRAPRQPPEQPAGAARGARRALHAQAEGEDGRRQARLRRQPEHGAADGGQEGVAHVS